MSNKTEYKDDKGRKIGHIEYDSSRRLVVKNKSGKTLAQYDPYSDRTHDLRSGKKFVGYGNLLTNFLVVPELEK